MNVKTPFYRQKKDYFCGPAVLQMAFAYFDKKLSQEKLAEMANTTKQHGTSRKNLIKAAKIFGFKVFAKSKATLYEIKSFLSEDKIVIVNFIEPSEEQGHYALVVGANPQNVILNDPENGKNFFMNLKEFNRRWKAKNKWFMAVEKR